MEIHNNTEDTQKSRVLAGHTPNDHCVCAIMLTVAEAERKVSPPMLPSDSDTSLTTNSSPVARFGPPHRLRRQGVFRPMSNDHVSTWIASVYTVHVIMFRGSATVYVVHVVKRTPRLGRVRGGGHLHGVCGRVNGYVMSTKALARIRRFMSDSMMQQSTLDSRYNFECIHRYEFSIIQSTKHTVYCFCNT